MTSSCPGCRDGQDFDVPITMAFQPICDVMTKTVFAYEALVRGADGAGASQGLGRVNPENRYAFDQTCRVKAIETASRLGLRRGSELLSINFLPNAVYEPRACIRQTLKVAQATNFPLSRIMFEFCETEHLNTSQVLDILKVYRSLGFRTAIDDFGSGYAGIGLLAQFQPDFVKIDISMVQGVDIDAQKRVILRHTLAMLGELGITPICEGIETADEMKALIDMGVRFMQGYAFARPAVAALAVPHWPNPESMPQQQPATSFSHSQ